MNTFTLVVVIIIAVSIIYKIVFYIKEKMFVKKILKDYTIHYSYKEKYPHMYLDEDYKKVFMYSKFRFKQLVYDYKDLVDVNSCENHEKVYVNDQSVEKKKSNYKTIVGTRTNDGVIVGNVFESRKKQKPQQTIVKERELYYHLSLAFKFKNKNYVYTFINSNTLNDSASFQYAMEEYNRLLDFGSHIWYGKDK